MYNSYWNLRESPFQNVTDLRFVYLSDQHKEGLARLLYLVNSRKLGGALIGQYGVGKSMVLELLAQNIAANQDAVFVRYDASPSGSMSLIRQLLARLELPTTVQDMGEALEAIYTYVQRERFISKHLIIAVDEAQLIKEPETIEFFHLLTNLKTTDRSHGGNLPAVTMIFSGHPDMMPMLVSDVSFGQRIQLVWKLEPLNDRQTLEYVHHRMRAAGGDIWVFEEPALAEIFRLSQGYPRLINNICDVTLMLGCVAGAPKITRNIVVQAAQEINPLAVSAAPKGEET